MTTHRITLSKHHITEILNLLETIQEETNIGTNNNINPFIKAFEKVWAPEEVFFPTCLSILGILEPNEKNEAIQAQSLMSVKWDTRARGADRAHPIIYQKLTKNIVEMAVREGCLFLRKIKNEVDLQDWIRIVLGCYGEKRKLHVDDDGERNNFDDGRKKKK